MTSASQNPDMTHCILRSLPSMNAILDALENPASLGNTDPATADLCSLLVASVPRPLLREAVEAFLDQQRAAVRQGQIRDTQALTLDVLLPHMARHAAEATAPHFRRVINATGVVIHTNLGRSPLAEEAALAVAEAARGYSNLEFDLDSGERGSRHSHVESLICRLTGAEAALAVNNNAAAVLLTLDTLCKGGEVIVSRGELVEIGGSFRIPAVMEKSGCTLREVGTTNRTHRDDYTGALTEHSAALMRVHTSNYRIIGFTKTVPRKELAALARERGIPLLEDLGSGMLLDLAGAGVDGLSGEQPVRQVLAEGVDVVMFSGDKVLGGPQAGIIAGKADYIRRIKKNQLSRALRIDKLTLAALEATLRLYTDPELAKQRIPTLRMLCMDKEELRHKALQLADEIRQELDASQGLSVTIREGASRVGGGAFPECDLPAFLVCIAGPCVRPAALQQALLRATPPVLARVEHDRLCFDPRTLSDDEYGLVARSLAAVAACAAQPPFGA